MKLYALKLKDENVWLLLRNKAIKRYKSKELTIDCLSSNIDIIKNQAIHYIATRIRCHVFDVKLTAILKKNVITQGFKI